MPRTRFQPDAQPDIHAEIAKLRRQVQNLQTGTHPARDVLTEEIRDGAVVPASLTAHLADTALDGGPHGFPALTADGMAWVRQSGALVAVDVATQAELDAHSHPKPTWGKLSDITPLTGQLRTADTGNLIEIVPDEGGRATLLFRSGTERLGKMQGYPDPDFGTAPYADRGLTLSAEGGYELHIHPRFLTFHANRGILIGENDVNAHSGIGTSSAGFKFYTNTSGPHQVWAINWMVTQWANMVASGYLVSSDHRVKRNIVSLPAKRSLSKIRHLRGVSFTDDDGDQQVGLIAQEVEESFPEVVAETPINVECPVCEGKGVVGVGLADCSTCGGTGTVEEARYGIDYGALVAPLVEAVKELASRLEKVELALADRSLRPAG